MKIVNCSSEKPDTAGYEKSKDAQIHETSYNEHLKYETYGNLYYIFAITVFPPTTLSPIFTVTSVPNGKNKSTRDPNLMNPNSSPCVTMSFSFTYHTIRLAMAPAICRNSTST